MFLCSIISLLFTAMSLHVSFLSVPFFLPYYLSFSSLQPFSDRPSLLLSPPLLPSFSPSSPAKPAPLHPHASTSFHQRRNMSYTLGGKVAPMLTFPLLFSRSPATVPPTSPTARSWRGNYHSAFFSVLSSDL